METIGILSPSNTGSLSGIEVTEETMISFSKIKQRTGNERKDLFVMQIKDSKVIEVYSQVTCTNDEFRDYTRNELSGKCAFIIFNVKKPSDIKQDKFGGFTWVSDDAPVTERMVYAATAEGVKQQLSDGVTWFATSTHDLDDLEDDILINKLKL